MTMTMEIDFESAVESVNVSPSNAIKTVLEAVVNSIQSCRYDDSNHNITVKIYTSQMDTDGNKSEIAEGFDIIDDGEGFTDRNFKSFCTLYSRAKKQSFGCKGVGRLTWLKVFKDVSVESVYSVGDSYYKREFSFSLDSSGVNGGDEPLLLDGVHSNRTVIKLRHCYPSFVQQIKTTPKSLVNNIADHCISFYLDTSKKVPVIRVEQNYSIETVNDVWEDIVKEDESSDLDVKNNHFHITHVKFYRMSTSKNGISLCADGLEVLPKD